MNIFNQKVAVITGAGSGIGRGLARELARRGARVVISDISTERIEETAELIRAEGGAADPSRLDVSDYGEVKKWIEDTFQSLGRVDYLFNNAGIAVGAEAKDMQIEDWQDVLAVNLDGVVHGVSAAYPRMVEQGFGHIINTASIEGLLPFAGAASYVASKFGVVGLTGVLRIEGAEHGVRVSALCPGYVKTAIFTDSKLINIDREKMMAELKDWMGVTPDECAQIVLRGVEKNRAVIVVTLLAKVLWWLYRISPSLAIWLMTKGLKRHRKMGIVK